MYIHTHTHTHIYIYIIRMYVHTYTFIDLFTQGRCIMQIIHGGKLSRSYMLFCSVLFSLYSQLLHERHNRKVFLRISTICCNHKSFPPRTICIIYHPLFSVFSQEYREYKKGKGVNPVVRFKIFIQLYLTIASQLQVYLVCF